MNNKWAVEKKKNVLKRKFRTRQLVSVWMTNRNRSFRKLHANRALDIDLEIIEAIVFTDGFFVLLWIRADAVGRWSRPSRHQLLPPFCLLPLGQRLVRLDGSDRRDQLAGASGLSSVGYRISGDLSVVGRRSTVGTVPHESLGKGFWGDGEASHMPGGVAGFARERLLG